MNEIHARDLRIIPLDEEGKPLFSYEGNKITFHKAGHYLIGSVLAMFDGREATEYAKINPPPLSDGQRRFVEQLEELIYDLHDPDPCQLDHDGDCQAHGWFVGGERNCPHGRAQRYFVALPEDRRDALNERSSDEVVSPEVAAAAHQGTALAWAKDGTLDLPALAAALGMEVTHGVLNTGQRAHTPHAVQVTRQTVPSGTRVVLAEREGDLPAVSYWHNLGHIARVEVTRSAGAVSLSVQARAETRDDVHELLDKAHQAIGRAVRKMGALLPDLNPEGMLAAKINSIRDELTNYPVLRTTADDLRTQLHETWKLNDADRATIGRILHTQACRLEYVIAALAPLGGPAHTRACDVMVQLRTAAREYCDTQYSEELASEVTAETEHLREYLATYQEAGARLHSPNGTVPWKLREWALLARQTMEQKAGQLGHVAGSGIVDKTREDLLQVVADYPDDLDTVQAEQATRNADEEAVRRLAHCMIEVANTLDVFHVVTDNVHMPYARVESLIQKLRMTVNTWTTEEQRRPWAQTAAGTIGIDPGSQHGAARLVDVMVESQEQEAARHHLFLTRTARAIYRALQRRYPAGSPARNATIRNIIGALERDLEAHGHPAEKLETVETEEGAGATPTEVSTPVEPHGARGADRAAELPTEVRYTMAAAEELTRSLRGRVPVTHTIQLAEVNARLRRALGL